MHLFKGYVRTKNKKCVEKFKGRTDFKTYKEVLKYDEFAGILGDETILIDIDDHDQSEIMMQIVEDLQLRCRVYETTRGKHFLFHNNGVDKCKTGTHLACGLVADIKVGSTASYSILKQDGKLRPIIYDKFEDEEYQDVPKWLFPIKTNMDFLGMEKGDGRNQKLFNYILTLQANDFSVEECRECIRIMNKYVLKEPLDDEELEVILRDEAFEKPIFFKKNQFLFDKFAVYLKNNKHIVKINNQLHIYRDGIYVDGAEEIEHEMIQQIQSLSKAKRSEVLSYIDVMIRDNVEVAPANLIAFKNGIYNIETNELEEFSPSKIVTNKINHNFVQDAFCEDVDKTLDKLSCDDKQIRMLLEEVVGYTFYRRNELRKSFILIGDKANGKSTFLDMIKTLLGDENTTALDLRELGDRFKTAELFGKLANIGDDIGDDFIQGSGAAAFKKLVSGDRMNAERKGRDPFDFSNYSKMLFSANNIPRIKDKSGAVINRLIIVPFNATFSPDDPDYDPYIKYKLRREEAMEYLVQLGIEGLKRVLKNRRFTVSKKVEKEIEEYEENNNPILLFFKEIELDEIINNPTKDVYVKYTDFCSINSFNPMSNIEFSKQIKKHYDIDIADKKVKGKKYRVFVRKEK